MNNRESSARAYAEIKMLAQIKSAELIFIILSFSSIKYGESGDICELEKMLVSDCEWAVNSLSSLLGQVRPSGLINLNYSYKLSGVVSDKDDDIKVILKRILTEKHNNISFMRRILRRGMLFQIPSAYEIMKKLYLSELKSVEEIKKRTEN